MYEYVMVQLAAWRGRWSEVAEGSGVPLRTLEKIARKESPNPRYNTIQSLYDWFIAQAKLVGPAAVTGEARG